MKYEFYIKYLLPLTHMQAFKICNLFNHEFPYFLTTLSKGELVRVKGYSIAVNPQVISHAVKEYYVRLCKKMSWGRDCKFINERGVSAEKCIYLKCDELSSLIYWFRSSTV